jgi:nicotinate phosphoribosyltransferase
VRESLEPGELGLLTDLYQLTMLQAYWREGMHGEAVFSLAFRSLPPGRNYAIACGLDDALGGLEHLRFPPDAIRWLGERRTFSADFLAWLAGLRFEGDVYAVPEGTPVFPQEPLLEVVAPLPAAQLAETWVLNQVHFQTVLASKAARVVDAAHGRPVIDFGLRRTPGTDAGLKSARAFHVAGVAATSNVLAGRTYGLPVTGTMAHSYVQAHDDEAEAFAAFADLYPGTVLLVDTYDTLAGVEKVIALARRRGTDFDVQAIRLDSGDLGALAVAARRRLDDAGLSHVRIFASGGLDEHAIARLVGDDAPIDAFGVGTHLGVSSDAPFLDMAYKLTEYAGKGRLKRSPGKEILPGRKQVVRVVERGVAVRDVLAADDESLRGRPLLRKVMERGRRLDGMGDLQAARARCRRGIEELPERLRSLAPAEPPYPVERSKGLRRREAEVRARLGL